MSGTDQVLTWRSSDPDRDPISYTLALGTRNPPPVVANGLNTSSYDPRTPEADIRYSWAITVTDGVDTVAGPTWSFTIVSPNQAPYAAYLPYPANRAIDVPLAPILSWEGSDPDRDALTYDVYFGTRNPPPVVSKNLTSTVYDPGPLAEGTSYYWSIDVTDGISTTIGSTWRFRTEAVTYVYLPLVVRQ